jgi:thioredoxin reductase (NADPH)
MTRPLKNLCEVAVIGGGLAGLSAARHAARLGRLVTLFEGSGLYGGQVATVEHVDGLPMPGRYSGQDLAIDLLEQARKVGVRVIERSVARVEAGTRLLLTDETGEVHEPEVIVVAAGGSLRMLGVPGEEAYYGRGVSRCASCDGGFFRNQQVVVVGGGDAAVHEALLLARICAQVIMVCRSPTRAKREYVDKLAAQRNVRFLWESEVEEILGDDGGVTGVRIGGETVACSGVFPFIGVVPNTGFLPAGLIGADGLIATDTAFATPDPRIFAIGAARRDYGGNAVQALAEGMGAAEAASRLLTGREEVRR